MRAWSRRQAHSDGVEPTLAELQEATRRFRKRMGFRSPDELEIWMRARGLDRDAFLRLMGDESRRQRLDEAIGAEIDEALADELSLAADFARLQSRAAIRGACCADDRRALRFRRRLDACIRVRARARRLRRTRARARVR